MSTPLEVNDAQIAEWRATGYPYKVIAARMAEWARDQDRRTVVPPNEFFAPGLGITATAKTWKRARDLLAAIGVFYVNDGPYQVS
jgi:hypothetical protein